MVHSLRHALYGLVAFLGVILAALAAAQATPSFPPTLVSVQARGPVSGGLSVMATFRAMPGGTAAANSAFFSVPVTLSPTTVGTLANGVMTRAVPVATVAAVIGGVGWFINESRTQVMLGNPNIPPPVLPGEFVWHGLGGARFSNSTDSAFQIRSFYPPFGAMVDPARNCVNVGTDRIECQAVWFMFPTGERTFSQLNMALRNTTTQPIVVQPFRQPVPLSDLGTLIINNPSTWPGVLTNADGSPVRTPELTQAAQTLMTQLNQGTQPAPHTGWDTGHQGGEPLPSPSPSPSPSPTPNPQPVELTFPVFCEWASAVCEFIDWMREAAPTYETVPLPMEDLETLRVPWSSGLGGGSCPTVSPVVLRDGWEVSIPVTVMCDLATLLRPVLILLASLLAVFILVGGVRAS